MLRLKNEDIEEVLVFLPKENLWELSSCFIDGETRTGLRFSRKENKGCFLKEYFLHIKFGNKYLISLFVRTGDWDWVKVFEFESNSDNRFILHFNNLRKREEEERYLIRKKGVIDILKGKVILKKKKKYER